ncbi:MAG: hypothetical protein WBD02_09560 [Acidimicrobiia bacterium]
MDLSDREDVRKLGIWLGRIRAGVGVAYLIAPDRSARSWFGGKSSSPSQRGMSRAFAVREFTIGLGVAIACAEGERGSDWLSIAGLTDAADTALTVLQPGIPLRSKLMVLLTAPAAVVHYIVARKTHEIVEPKRAVEV